MERVRALVAVPVCVTALALCTRAIAQDSGAALSITVYPSHYAIESERFDSLDTLKDFAKPLMSERFTVIVDECSAWSRGIELYNTLWQLTREHALELKPSKTRRTFQFEPGISAPPECDLRFNHDVFTLGAFVDERPDSIALSMSSDSTCPAPAERVQDVAEGILRAWDIEPLTWPQLPDWYGLHVRLTCRHEQHLVATVSFIDSKGDDFIEYGTVGHGDIDFSDDRWSRWRKDVGDYHAVADELVRRALNDFLVYNTTYFFYTCSGSNGCGMSAP